MFYNDTDRASRLNYPKSKSDLKRLSYEEIANRKSRLWLGVGAQEQLNAVVPDHVFNTTHASLPIFEGEFPERPERLALEREEDMHLRRERRPYRGFKGLSLSPYLSLSLFLCRSLSLFLSVSVSPSLSLSLSLPPSLSVSVCVTSFVVRSI